MDSGDFDMNFDMNYHKLQKYKIKLENAYMNNDVTNIDLYQQKYDYYVGLVGGFLPNIRGFLNTWMGNNDKKIYKHRYYTLEVTPTYIKVIKSIASSITIKIGDYFKNKGVIYKLTNINIDVNTPKCTYVVSDQARLATGDLITEASILGIDGEIQDIFNNDTTKKTSQKFERVWVNIGKNKFGSNEYSFANEYGRIIIRLNPIKKDEILIIKGDKQINVNNATCFKLHGDNKQYKYAGKIQTLKDKLGFKAIVKIAGEPFDINTNKFDKKLRYKIHVIDVENVLQNVMFVIL